MLLDKLIFLIKMVVLCIFLLCDELQTTNDGFSSRCFGHEEYLINRCIELTIDVPYFGRDVH